MRTKYKVGEKTIFTWSAFSIALNRVSTLAERLTGAALQGTLERIALLFPQFLTNPPATRFTESPRRAFSFGFMPRICFTLLQQLHGALVYLP